MQVQIWPERRDSVFKQSNKINPTKTSNTSPLLTLNLDAWGRSCILWRRFVAYCVGGQQISGFLATQSHCRCCIKSKAGVKLGCTLKSHSGWGEDLCGHLLSHAAHQFALFCSSLTSSVLTKASFRNCNFLSLLARLLQEQSCRSPQSQTWTAPNLFQCHSGGLKSALFSLVSHCSYEISLKF